MHLPDHVIPHSLELAAWVVSGVALVTAAWVVRRQAVQESTETQNRAGVIANEAKQSRNHDKPNNSGTLRRSAAREDEFIERFPNAWPTHLAGMGALIFVLQMLNFPIAAGVSAHVLGAALAARLLGVPLAMLVMAAVVSVQAFVFGDGGVAALGLNLLAMAVVAPAVWLARPLWQGSVWLGDLLFGLLSMLAAVSLVGGVLLAANVAPVEVILTTLLWAHFLAGLVEGLLPRVGEWLARTGNRVTVGTATVAALIVTPWAAAAPDALDALLPALPRASVWLAEYQVPGISHAGLGTLLAGLLGALLVAGVLAVLTKVVVSKPRGR